MLTNRLIYSFAKVIAVVAITSTMGFSQGEQRSIDKISWRFEPIRISKLKTKEKSIEFGKAFLEEEDWLKGLTATAQNATDKPIARIELELIFPREDGSEQNNYVIFMHYGKDPSAPDAAAVKRILPGETADIKLNELNVPIIKRSLKRLGYPEKIHRVQIRVRSVTFADGTMWSGDFILSPDPANPGRKINPKRLDIPFDRKDDPDAVLNRERPRDWSSRFNHMTFRTTIGRPFDVLRSDKSTRWNSAPVQASAPCNLIFFTDDTEMCTGEWLGCNYPKDVFVSPGNYPWLADARKVSATVDCQGGEDVICEGQLHTTDLRTTCGLKIAGTCGGSSSGGCNSGFTDLGGYCGRSYTFQSHCMASAFYTRNRAVVLMDGNPLQS